jgi:hypothetical protein
MSFPNSVIFFFGVANNVLLGSTLLFIFLFAKAKLTEKQESIGEEETNLQTNFQTC